MNKPIADQSSGMPDTTAQPTEVQSTEVLAGSIERVTFHSAESGFCVLRIKAHGHRDLVTVVGHAAVISAGEWVTVSGTWVNSREHGQQFKASFLKASAPTTAEGIEKYLGSGMIRGIGPIYASKLVAVFGAEVGTPEKASCEQARLQPCIRGQAARKHGYPVTNDSRISSSQMFLSCIRRPPDHCQA
jgi:exodeoxyribonuclease V alpha subunit